MASIPPPWLIVPVYIEFSERECMNTTYIILVCSDNQWVILAIDEILIKARRTKSNTTASLAILGAIFVFWSMWTSGWVMNVQTREHIFRTFTIHLLIHIHQKTKLATRNRSKLTKILISTSLDKNFITAWKSITKLVIFRSFVAKCCKMRII
jgi:hypothetical protein